MTTTFQTATALKSAGFPQPAPAPGQYWHEEGGRLVWLQFIYKHRAHEFEKATFQVLGGENWSIEYPFDEMKRLTYAPTAPEILRELGQDFYLSLFDGGFACADCNANPEEDVPEFESADEACAMAWLAKQKSKSTKI